MVRLTLQYLWKHRHELMKYAIVGCSGVLLDMGLLVGFKEGFDLNPTVAIVISQIFVLGYNFSLNKYWSFKSTAFAHKQLVRYLTLAGFNYCVSIVTMYFFNELLGLDYRLVRIGTIAVMTSWNFLLYKYWVYRSSEPVVQSQQV